MAYKVIIIYRLYMPSYFLGTFTEYPYLRKIGKSIFRLTSITEEETNLPFLGFMAAQLKKSPLEIERFKDFLKRKFLVFMF